jgi:hypothetical protein
MSPLSRRSDDVVAFEWIHPGQPAGRPTEPVTQPGSDWLYELRLALGDREHILEAGQARSSTPGCRTACPVPATIRSRSTAAASTYATSERAGTVAPASAVVTALCNSAGPPSRPAKSRCAVPIGIGASVPMSASAAMRPRSRSAAR